jgi:hypothetical protein
MAYLDRGIGEAYVSPQIEAVMGFSQSEWLEDPVRWYQQIHPDDKMLKCRGCRNVYFRQAVAHRVPQPTTNFRFSDSCE